MPELVTKHRSHGPHLQFTDSVLFITWRLAFTLPQHVIKLFKGIRSSREDKNLLLEDLKQQNSYVFQKFWEFDAALGVLPVHGISLNEAEVAKIIHTAIHFYAGKMYILHAYCLMCNHLHLVLQALPKEDGDHYHVEQIVQSLKKYTSKKIKELTSNSTQVWDNYYFDRIIRDEENYYNVLNYVLNNPVKAGLVDDAGKWKDSYVNMEVCNV